MDHTYSEERHHQLRDELAELQNQLQKIVYDLENERFKGHPLGDIYRACHNCEEKIENKKRELKECHPTGSNKSKILYDTQSIIAASSVQRKDDESLIKKQKELHDCRTGHGTYFKH